MSHPPHHPPLMVPSSPLPKKVTKIEAENGPQLGQKEGRKEAKKSREICEKCDSQTSEQDQTFRAHFLAFFGENLEFEM